MFPGVRIKDWQQIVEAMKSRLTPSSISPVDLRGGWRRLGGTGSDIEPVLKGERFYIWYEHPVHPFKNQLFQADRDAVLKFWKRDLTPSGWKAST